MTLREVLHAHIPTLYEDSTVRDAVDKMDVYQFPALVVVDGDGAPVGVLTEGDLCRAASTRDSLTSMANEPAIVYATREPTVAPADTDIGDAFHRMLSSGLTLLPVVEEARLMGIVLRVDLMQAMLTDADPANDPAGEDIEQ
jgi:CBS domain-containing protein